MCKIIVTLMFTFASFLCCAQVASDKEEDLQPLLQDVFAKVKQYSVYKSKIDWKALETQVLQRDAPLLSSDDFEQRVKLIFQTVGDPHGALYYKGRRIRNSDNATFKVRPALKEAIDEVFGGTNAEVRATLLENGYGYLLVPGTGKNDQSTCQQLQDSLCSLGLKNLKGIIIDLRLNEGGSVYPGYSGLNQLFGSEQVAHSANLEGVAQTQWSVKKGNFYQGTRRVAAVTNRCRPNKDIKIAVLISQITASSGEMLAVAFKGRANTLFIGEKTYGFTSINSEFKIGGYYLAVASGFIADREGTVYFDGVKPDVEIIEGDNFKNLHEDLKVKAALQWLKQE